MEKNKAYQQSILTIYDGRFLTLIKEFSQEASISESVPLERFIHLFYKVSKKEKDLFTHKNLEIQLNKLKLFNILKIQKYIQLLVNNNELDNSEARILLNYLYQFCIFLRKKEIANLYYTPPKYSATISSKKKQDNAIVLKFVNYMESMRYATSTIQNYRTSIDYFLNYSKYNQIKHHSNEFWQSSIVQFENYLKKRVHIESINLSTAYAYLKAIKLFFKFLYEENQIIFKYKIPNNLIQNGKRSNEYVSIQDVILVTEKIFELSKDILRDISIFLIILETGCRPIEIVNLYIDDIYLHEKLIVLKSKKSNQRTLSLTETTISFIKQYLQIRENYLPQSNSQVLFLTSLGKQLSSRYISTLFRKYNLKTFNEIRFTPKTLRHTFITNALNNNISFTEVKESVGHKHLVSTHYYLYRDINQLKKIFMDKKLF